MLDPDRIEPPDPKAVLRRMRAARKLLGKVQRECAQLHQVDSRWIRITDPDPWFERMTAAHKAYMALLCAGDLGGEE